VLPHNMAVHEKKEAGLKRKKRVGKHKLTEKMDQGEKRENNNTEDRKRRKERGRLQGKKHQREEEKTICLGGKRKKRVKQPGPRKGGVAVSKKLRTLSGLTRFDATHWSWGGRKTESKKDLLTVEQRTERKYARRVSLFIYGTNDVFQPPTRNNKLGRRTSTWCVEGRKNL